MSDDDQTSEASRPDPTPGPGVPPPPPRPRMRSLLLAEPSTRGRWAPALRAGLALLLPALILYACGMGDHSMLAALGSFAVLYGERRPYKIRWKVIVTTGTLLVVTTFAFGLIGAAAGPDATAFASLFLVAALALLAGLAVFVVTGLRLGPPGPFFLVLAAGVAWFAARHGIEPGVLALCTAAGGLGALAAGMAPMLYAPRGPEIAATHAAVAAAERYLSNSLEPDPSDRHGVASSTLTAWSVLHDAAQTDGELARRLWEAHHRVHGAQARTLTAPLPRPSIRRRFGFALRPESAATVNGVRIAAAALGSGAVAVALGLSRPDWAIMGAVLVLQLGPDRIRGTIRGVHRIVGTVLGVGLFAVLHALNTPLLALLLVLTVLNVLIELTVTTNYAVAVAFITPLALLMGGSPDSLATQVTERILETVLGVAVALLALWVLLPRAHRGTLRSADAMAVRHDLELVEMGSRASVTDPDVRIARRDLQWLLIEAALAASNSSSDEPSWTQAHWQRHSAVRDLGYDTLAAFWRTEPGAPLPAPVVDELLPRARALA